ncbi:hypothetical protein PAAL109150_07170 [Paenibacillus alkaliterrae]
MPTKKCDRVQALILIAWIIGTWIVVDHLVFG